MDFTVPERALANYCRKNQPSDIPGVRPDRVPVYRGLISNIFEDTLLKAYPITAALLGEDSWKELVDEFVANYECAPPELWKMPWGLVDYSKKAGLSDRLSIPFLDDLLLFEWIEIEIHIMPDPEIPIRGENDSRIILNPAAELLCLSYPVFRGQSVEDFSTEGDFRLLIYRHPVSCEVHFMELAPFYALIVAALLQAPRTAQEILSEFVGENNVTKELIDKTNTFVEALREQGMAL